MNSVCTRAVKMAENLNSNFVLKYLQCSNLKGIISVRGEKATRGRIELNITNARLFKTIK